MSEPLPPPLPPKPPSPQRSTWLLPLLVAAVCGGGVVALGCGGLMCGGLLLLKSARSPEAPVVQSPSDAQPAENISVPNEAVAGFVPAPANSPTAVSEERPEAWPFPNDPSGFVEPDGRAEAPLRGDEAEAAAIDVLGAILGGMFGDDEEYEPLSEEQQIEEANREFERRRYYIQEAERARAEREAKD